MHHIFKFQKSPIALLLVVLLSGLPIPILDSHPTDTSAVGDNVRLQEHLAATPSVEHADVDDAEIHIHWVSPLIVKSASVASISPEVLPSVTHLSNGQLHQTIQPIVLSTWAPEIFSAHGAHDRWLLNSYSASCLKSLTQFQSCVRMTI